MGNSKQAVNNLRNMIIANDRTYRWLSRETGLPYKRILAEVKNETRTLSLETAVASAAALGTELPEILKDAA